MALTWRNVAAPDFSPAMRGQEIFARLLSDGFASAQRGLDRYDDSISEQVNNAIQLRIAGADDTDAAKAILAGLQTDPNAKRISDQTLNLAMARPDALTQQAFNEGRLDDSIYNRQRVRGFDAAEDRFAKLYADRQAAYAKGTEEGQAWDAANPNAMDGLSLAATRQNVQDASAATMGALDITGKELSNEGARLGIKQAEFDYDTGVWRFGNEKADRADVEAAQGFMANFQGSGYTLEDLNGQLASSGLSPGAQAIVRAQTGQNIPGSYGDYGGSAGGGAGGSVTGHGGVSAYDVLNYQARGQGFESVPSSVKTVGDAMAFGKSMLNDMYSRGVPRGTGSSAMGLYQITQSTMAEFGEQALGKNWRKADWRDPETQDRLGRAIFEGKGGVRGSAQRLADRWAMFKGKPQLAAQVARMPWEQAREIIAKGESGASPAALLLAQTVSGASANQQYQQTNSASGIATSIQPYMRDTAPLATVVTRLTKEGPLKGATTQFVSGQIQRIKQQAATGRNPVRLTDAAAGEILVNSLAANDNWFGNFFNPSDPAANGDWKIDPKLLRSNIDQVRPGAPDNTLVANQSMEVLAGQVQATRAAWEAASQRLAGAQQQAARNPRFDSAILGRLIMEERQARAAWQNAIEMQQSSAVETGAAPAPRQSALPRRQAQPRPAPRREERPIGTRYLPRYRPGVSGPKI
ncbi:MAG: hypothetical protein Unbinned4120contig1000_8 [Prokaryotic dsDNA virus sp.]|jgi:hypothetical protein|nr:MAG: hypothetical protein Unbinned4120contig1000_8 [Prokaryotic dsDNA virus sp.]|tara:strand:+ start:58992 stop:61073 length:2082 start_codon:yes stop_codon:yes gene_type:complete